MRPVRFFPFLLATLALSSWSCGVAAGLADNAPFAKPPEIVKVGARQWDSDTAYYNSGGAFELTVKFGLANELIIKENGTELTRVSGPPAPNTSTPTVYI